MICLQIGRMHKGTPLILHAFEETGVYKVQNYYKAMRKTIFARANRKDRTIPSDTKGQPCLIYKNVISLQLLLHELADGLAAQTALEDCTIGSKENDVRD